MLKSGCWIFFHSGSEPDYCQNLMESKLGPSSPIFSLLLFHEDPTSSICIILLTDRQINSYKLNASLAEITRLCLGLHYQGIVWRDTRDSGTMVYN